MPPPPRPLLHIQRPRALEPGHKVRRLWCGITPLPEDEYEHTRIRSLVANWRICMPCFVAFSNDYEKRPTAKKPPPRTAHR